MSSTKPLYVNLIWHMHQPYYKDLVTGQWSSRYGWDRPPARPVGRQVHAAYRHLYAEEACFGSLIVYRKKPGWAIARGGDESQMPDR